MGISIVPTSIASKLPYLQTLTTSGSFTVPSGVTNLNLTCVGGGGGGGGSSNSNSAVVQPGAGGTTSFSTISALGGAGGSSYKQFDSGNGTKAYTPVSAPRANTGQGGYGSAFNDQNQGFYPSIWGQDAPIVKNSLAVTPGQTISYTIGAGGTAGTGSVENGTAGANGYIIVEWWV
jgi:hypothetical protein